MTDMSGVALPRHLACAVPPGPQGVLSLSVNQGFRAEAQRILCIPRTPKTNHT